MAFRERSFASWQEKCQNTEKGEREGRGEHRQRVQILQCGVLHVTITGPSAARPQRRSLMLPFKSGVKTFEPVYSAGNHKRSGALTRAMHM